MEKNLIIVESPAKSQTIEKYLGEDFVVASSKGHIRDLSTKGPGGFGVEIENNFKPIYRNLRDKLPVVKELKKLVKDAKKVYLATDPDREGEAISWHLYEVLELADKDYERIVFNEITRQAILKALENGRKIDIDLVHSQESRRILDRIIGFSLSKLLQKKIGSKSAGRVQSVALKLIVDREKEIQAFVPEEYWEIFLNFLKEEQKIKAKLIADASGKIHLKNKDDADAILHALGPEYRVSEIVKKDRKKPAKPPFITSTLQQEASGKFNFSSKKTMLLAQKLYEGIELGAERVGLITYMRTDSFRLSEQFLGEARAHILEKYGKEYYRGSRASKEKGKNVQDAHEAIRPTSLKYAPESVKAYLSNDEYRLYSLIYYRALASQMSDAVVEDQKIRIENRGYVFEADGERIVFDGFLKVYGNMIPEQKNTTRIPTRGKHRKPGNQSRAEIHFAPPALYGSETDPQDGRARHRPPLHLCDHDGNLETALLCADGEKTLHSDRTGNSHFRKIGPILQFCHQREIHRGDGRSARRDFGRQEDLARRA